MAQQSASPLTDNQQADVDAIRRFFPTATVAGCLSLISEFDCCYEFWQQPSGRRKMLAGYAAGYKRFGRFLAAKGGAA